MASITEMEFARLCDGIHDDREMIWKYNPNGTKDEILLWMLLSCLISYLNLLEIETPCFPGKPTADTYHEAILSIVKSKSSERFDADKYLRQLTGRDSSGVFENQA